MGYFTAKIERPFLPKKLQKTAKTGFSRMAFSQVNCLEYGIKTLVKIFKFVVDIEQLLQYAICVRCFLSLHSCDNEVRWLQRPMAEVCGISIRI